MDTADPAFVYNGCVSIFAPLRSPAMNQSMSLPDEAKLIQAPETGRGACCMHQLCLPMSLEDAGMNRLEQIIGRRRRLVRDERLYAMGEPFRNLYAVRFGHCQDLPR